MSNTEKDSERLQGRVDRLFVIDRTTGKFLIAEEVEVHDSRVLEYETPLGHKGYIQPDGWNQVQQKPLKAIDDMFVDGAVSTDGKREYRSVTSKSEREVPQEDLAE